jgi:hypothetical protein
MLLLTAGGMNPADLLSIAGHVLSPSAIGKKVSFPPG